MKKIILVCAFLLIIICIYLFRRNLGSESVVYPSPTDTAITVTATQMPQQPVYTVTHGQETYAYDFFTTRTYGNLSLIPNFDTKKSGEQLAADHTCVSAINGGFYTTEHTPLGQFVSGGVTRRKQISSSLVNGFISYTTSEAAIGDSPIDAATTVLQTGPLLFTDGAPLHLSIRDDQHERRMVAAMTSGGDLIFMALYMPDAVFQGPLLGDVPDIIRTVAGQEHMTIRDAINLDGGSASFFKNGTHTISELQYVGSLFCLQK